jgi:hypothetical protein
VNGDRGEATRESLCEEDTKAMPRLLLVACALAALTVPALADTFPVDGRFAVVTSFTDRPPDCAGKRIIAFSGNQRTDSQGGVPAFRNRSVEADGASRWRITDIVTTGQINNARAVYTLRALDTGRLEMVMQPGGTLKLQRCK